jgi:phage shock protein A
VALAAIQRLYQLAQEKDAEIAVLKKRNEKVEARLAVMEEKMMKLEAVLGTMQ